MLSWASIALNHPREKTPTPIVGDGGLANTVVTDGRMVPVLILDTTERPDMDEFVRLHDASTAGDVNCQWAHLRFSPHVISLVLSFLRPAPIVVVLDFDLRRQHAILVEHILACRAVILQPGRAGDRVSEGLDRPKVIVGVPDLVLADHWSRILKSYARREMKRRGLKGADASVAADAFIRKIRSLAAFRLRPDAGSADVAGGDPD